MTVLASKVRPGGASFDEEGPKAWYSHRIRRYLRKAKRIIEGT